MLSENQYGLKNIQSELLDILKVFDSYCKEKGIDYSVFAGTKLGAVREQGFIPWDDDVDVVMTMENFLSLKKELKNNEDYYIDMEDAWVPRFRSKKKKNGPFVDVFLLAVAPKGIKKTVVVYKLKALQGMLKKYDTVKKVSPIYKVLLWITKRIGKLFSREFLLKQYWKIGYEKKYSSNNYFVPNIGFNYLNMEFSRDRLEKGYTYIPFEDMNVEVYKEYEYMLTIHFGPDYMTPVNITERISYHANQIKN